MITNTLKGVLLAGMTCFAAGAQAQNITLVSGPSGGTWYPLGAAIAKIIEDAIPGARVSHVNAVTVSNILGTSAGQYDLAMSLSTSNVDAINGAGDPFPQPQENKGEREAAQATSSPCPAKSGNKLAASVRRLSLTIS